MERGADLIILVGHLLVLVHRRVVGSDWILSEIGLIVNLILLSQTVHWVMSVF